jgi:hypothetical protein
MRRIRSNAPVKNDLSEALTKRERKGISTQSSKFNACFMAENLAKKKNVVTYSVFQLLTFKKK